MSMLSVFTYMLFLGGRSLSLWATSSHSAAASSLPHYLCPSFLFLLLFEAGVGPKGLVCFVLLVAL